jgi:hypothetical protein
MRWFKHLTAAHNDEALAEVLDEFGAEGYGMWWLILEKIAAQMDKTDRCFARYSLKNWSKTCQVSAKKFQKFVSFLSKLEKLSAKKCEKNSNFLIIECPNLLKFRDEYTKKSGQTPERRRKKSNNTPSQETEAETDTEADSPKPPNPEIYPAKQKMENPEGGLEFESNPEVQKALKDCKNILGISNMEAVNIYGATESDEVFIEAVKVTVERTLWLMKEKGEPFNNPGAYLKHAIKNEYQSKTTRAELCSEEKLNSEDKSKILAILSRAVSEKTEKAMWKHIRESDERLHKAARGSDFLFELKEKEFEMIFDNYRRGK